MKANFILAANWKLNKSPQQVREFFADMSQLLAAQPDMARRMASIRCLIFPQALSAAATHICVENLKLQLEPLQKYAPTASSMSMASAKADSKNDATSTEAAKLQVAQAGPGLAWGGQNIATEAQGAYTGENSAQVLKAMGAQYVLIGHSERRQLYGETDAQIEKKIQLVQSLGLTPMLCVGETLQQRSQVQQILGAQLTFIKNIDTHNLLVAYEPVWAIGTGHTASVDDVKTARRVLKELVPEHMPVLYGGSVKAAHAAELSQVVDGFLVGSASLVPTSFLNVLQNIST